MKAVAIVYFHSLGLSLQYAVNLLRQHISYISHAIFSIQSALRRSTNQRPITCVSRSSSAVRETHRDVFFFIFWEIDIFWHERIKRFRWNVRFLLYFRKFSSLWQLRSTCTISHFLVCRVFSNQSSCLREVSASHDRHTKKQHVVSPDVFNKPGNLCFLLLRSFFQGGTSVPLKPFPDIWHSFSAFYKVFLSFLPGRCPKLYFI